MRCCTIYDWQKSKERDVKYCLYLFARVLYKHCKAAISSPYLPFVFIGENRHIRFLIYQVVRYTVKSFVFNQPTHTKMFKQLLSLLLLSTLAFAAPTPDHEDDHEDNVNMVNRTFTMVTRSTKPQYNGLPLMVGPPSGISSLLAGTNFTKGSVEPFKGFIYNGQLFRPCKTSPTGACLAILTKEFAGALTGWMFQFSDSETPLNLGPGSGPITGTFAVIPDPDAPTTGSKCKPAPKLFAWGESRFWTLCSTDPLNYYVRDIYPTL